MFIRPEARFMGRRRVVSVGPLTNLQPLGSRNVHKARSPAAQAIPLGQRLALRRNTRVQVEGMVLDMDVPFLAQLVDPSLADVAPWSDEVAEDRECNCPSHTVISLAKC